MDIKLNTTHNIITIVVIILILVSINMTNCFPWWGFSVFVLLFGAIISFKKWKINFFLIGFLSGFFVWFGLNFYNDLASDGIILNKISSLIEIPKFVVLIISGLIGGITTGLSLYTGNCLFKSFKYH